MKTLLLSAVLLTLVACDVDDGTRHTWNDRSTAPTVISVVPDPQSSDVDIGGFIDGLRTPPPPPLSCAAGYDRVNPESTTALYCQRRQGAPWSDDPCLGLRVVSTIGDVVECQ